MNDKVRVVSPSVLIWAWLLGVEAVFVSRSVGTAA